MLPVDFGELLRLLETTLDSSGLRFDTDIFMKI